MASPFPTSSSEDRPTAGEILRPTIGYTVSFGNVHGYVEAYGAGLERLTAAFDVAADADAPALLHVAVPTDNAGSARSLFSAVMPVHQLPAGQVLLRATLLQGAQVVKTLTRAFEVAPPAILMASAEALGAEKSADAELFLPVGDELLARPFRRDDALKPETLAPFRSAAAPSVKASFDTGVAFLTSGDYAKAETNLKKAIQPDVDSTPALAYLAVTFAAAGHDPEAASAFQTSLADGSELPQIYEWLGDTLMRTHDLSGARSILEEAVGKWPADSRFTRPLAMLYATFGRGREAVRTLERYLTGQPPMRTRLYLAVEWLYNVHAAGGLVHNRTRGRQARAHVRGRVRKDGRPARRPRQTMDEFLERNGNAPFGNGALPRFG